MWFSAIYLLLFISLIGCILPRVKKHAQALRTPPPRTPSRLDRLPQNGAIRIQPASESGLSDAQIAREAAALLKKRGYRSEARTEGANPSVGAERGYTREIGNLLFHTSLVGLLASVGIGGAFGYNGQHLLVEGDTFVNSLVSYDAFTPGTWFQEDSLDPYSVKLEKSNVTFDRESTTHFGQPLDFTAEVETRRSPDAEPEKETIRVNHPLRIDGADMYLVGNGYAPMVTVRDGDGDVAFSGPVVSVPQDGMYTSLMVIKAPDAKPDQLGFQGFLLPTAMTDETGFAISGDPNAINPQLQLNSYYGDLGLDAGIPEVSTAPIPRALTCSARPAPGPCSRQARTTSQALRVMLLTWTHGHPHQRPAIQANVPATEDPRPLLPQPVARTAPTLHVHGQPEPTSIVSSLQKGVSVSDATRPPHGRTTPSAPHRASRRASKRTRSDPRPQLP